MIDEPSANRVSVSSQNTAAAVPNTEQPNPLRPRAHPARAEERVEAVDVLRGVALLGILTMNIVLLGWPLGGYENPHFSGGVHTANTLSWAVNSLLFSGKMMSLFSMLFGAGLVLMSERTEARGASILGVFYRRIFWLLVIGLLHAYLIWSGDILVMYAACGLLLYLFRKWSPRTLIIVAVILLLIQAANGIGFGLYARFVYGVAQHVEANMITGEESSEWQLQLHGSWNEMRSFVQPTKEDFDKEIATYRKGYLHILVARVPEVFMFQIFGLLMFALWGVGGRMLLGMALMKLGVFTGKCSWYFYRRLALFGYGLGVPLTVAGTITLFVRDFAALQAPVGGTLFGLGMVPTALGHAAMVMMVCKSGRVRWLTQPLAAVGRMALTNYLMQSVIGTFLFYGYGAGLYGRVDRVGLWGIVLAVWLLQLWYSPLWLKYFRYGPAEWLWRSLTYWQRQPLRHPSPA